MRLTSIFPIAIALLLAAATACQDDNNTIGSSIVQDDVTITVDSSFTITGVSVANPCIQSRTINQLLGRIDADAFGIISSDFVTQFMPASRLDTTGVSVADIDSLVLVMTVGKGDFIGDSIVPMGLEVYPLIKELPSPIFSDFDPTGFYSPVAMASKIYNLSSASADTIESYKYRQIRVKMPLELGRKFFTEYKTNPAVFSSPTKFAEFFPGVYVKNSYGSGRISTITNTMLNLYFHKTTINPTTQRDTVVSAVGNYFAVTPEIVTNNNISLAVSSAIHDRVANAETIVMGPTGYDVKVRFPAPELIARFKASASDLSVVNNLYLTIPGEVIENEDGIEPPATLLCVLATKREEFFASNELPDGVTAFYATWDSLNKSYSFGDINLYLNHLLSKDTITEEDYTFILTPVTRQEEITDEYYGTTSLITLNPYVNNPAMVRILLDKAKIKLTFTSQVVGTKIKK